MDDHSDFEAHAGLLAPSRPLRSLPSLPPHGQLGPPIPLAGPVRIPVGKPCFWMLAGITLPGFCLLPTPVNLPRFRSLPSAFGHGLMAWQLTG
jgi:hypothetical protein